MGASKEQAEQWVDSAEGKEKIKEINSKFRYFIQHYEDSPRIEITDIFKDIIKEDEN